MTEYQGRIVLGEDSVAELADRIEGSVFAPDDAGYVEAIAGFNLRSQHRPCLVVAAAGAADVQAAVAFAAARDLPVGVMATGHQPFPAADGFLLVTTRAMRTVEIDAERGVARVGAGALWSDVVEPAQAEGLAPLNGSSPLVGVVGFTLGGGLSPFLGRSYGWAADHVVAIEVVTPDGALRRVSAEVEPELFWGLRGGRSNFGVVTELEIGLFPVTSFYGGGIFFPAEHVEAVVRAFPEVVRDAPDAFTCSVALLNFPPVPEIPEPLRGRFLAHVRVTHLGSDEEAEKLIAPFRAIGEGVLDTVGRHPYSAFALVHTDPADPFPYEDRAPSWPSCRPRPSSLSWRAPGWPPVASSRSWRSGISAVRWRSAGRGEPCRRPGRRVQRVGSDRRAAGGRRRRYGHAGRDDRAPEPLVHGPRVHELRRSRRPGGGRVHRRRPGAAARPEEALRPPQPLPGQQPQRRSGIGLRRYAGAERSSRGATEPPGNRLDSRRPHGEMRAGENPTGCP
jgi:hypothetical protein